MDWNKRLHILGHMSLKTGDELPGLGCTEWDGEVSNISLLAYTSLETGMDRGRDVYIT